MKLATWNCCRGSLETRRHAIVRLGADVTVLQEIARPSAARDDCAWFGDDPKIGLAVLARLPYKLTALEARPNVPKYVFPVVVEGDTHFLLFAVWTVGGQSLRHVRAVHGAIAAYSDLLTPGTPVVLLGDFNSNARWDGEHPRALNHSALVDKLGALGVVSAYHSARSVAHGQEREHTFFQYKQRDRGYHIDYCFLPATWVDRLERVEVGAWEDWHTSSDHCPVIVSIAV